MRALILAAGLIATQLGGPPAAAQGRTITLVADERLAATGFLKYLLPRFSLKHRVRVELTAGPAAGLADLTAGADALIGPAETAAALREAGQGLRPRAAFYVERPEGLENFSAMVLGAAPNPEPAALFLDWLTSEIGQRTVAAFAAPDAPRYLPGALQVVPEAEIVPQGDISAGEKLAYFHCGRCHVISDRNRFGGIGSTPSFPALRSIPGWQDKFLSFWSLNPHPSFTRVEGLTPPFDPDRPPHIAPVILTLEETEAIAAFAATIAPKDLGAPISLR